MNRNDKEFIVQKIRTQYTEKENTQLDELKRLGNGKIHVTIGSALDIFGGKLDFDTVVDRIEK